jgi:nucleotide-binding universal stress UspA family protein
MAKIARILVPLDLGESSARTLDYAKTVAQPFGASLVLLHVVPNPYVTAASDVYLPPPQEFLDTLVRDARSRLEELAHQVDRGTLPVETVVQVGDPLVEIVNVAASRLADLIVMGTHGRTGVAHFMLGSVAERVVRTAPCPVLTIR